MVKIKAIYPHKVGDMVDLWGFRFYREDDGNHYAVVDEDAADELVAGGNAQIVETDVEVSEE